MPNFIEIEETFCERTDGSTDVLHVCMHGRTEGRTFQTGFIRSRRVDLNIMVKK